MPWKSQAQARWGHSPAGLRALGGRESVKEWDRSTTPGSLPERSSMAKGTSFGTPRGEVIKHPGALTEAAKRSGRSKLQEAETEKKSASPKIRARGALGARFIKKAL